MAILNDEGFAVEAASTAAQGLTRAMGVPPSANARMAPRAERLDGLADGVLAARRRSTLEEALDLLARARRGLGSIQGEALTFQVPSKSNPGP